MLAKVKDDRHQRIDRILVRSQCLKPASIRLLGTEPIAGTSEVFPSDHFGVVAELRCSDAHEHCSSIATAGQV
jgi:endonuclease/exonuclease/phosphatase family metal-dependent hydrolase